MKLSRTLVFSIVFSAFFCLGFSQGSRSSWLAAFLPSRLDAARALQNGKDAPAHTPQPLPPGEDETPAVVPTQAEPTPAPVVLEGQMNLLIIGVNHLQAPQPRLEAVWIAMTLPGSPRLTLMPVYPSGSAAGAESNPDQSLTRLFELDENGRPSPLFLSALKTNGLWWSGYLLVDQIALIELVEFVNDLDVEAEAPINGVLAVTGQPDSEEDGPRALAGQTELAAELCRRTLRISPSVDLTPLFALFPSHARTDLDASDLASAWIKLREMNHGLSCEFPARTSAP